MWDSRDLFMCLFLKKIDCGRTTRISNECTKHTIRQMHCASYNPPKNLTITGLGFFSPQADQRKQTRDSNFLLKLEY